MKKFLALVFLLCALPAVFSLSVDVNGGSFTKGDEIIVSGNGTNFVSLKIFSVEGKKEIEEKTVRVESDRSFSFTYTTSCSDPAGEWIVLAEERGETAQKSFRVFPPLECGYYSIGFNSPSPAVYHRTSTMNVSVVVKDNRVPVKDAKVFLWGTSGRREEMIHRGNGLYLFQNLSIPADAELGRWELVVTAGKKTLEGIFGGEGKVSITVDGAPISFERLSPKAKEFQFGEKLAVRVRPLYLNSRPAEGARVFVSVAGNRVQAEEIDAGVFQAVFPTADLNNELLHVVLEADDPHGNSGEERFYLQPSGYYTYLLKENAVFWIVPVLILSYIFFLAFREARVFFMRVRLKRRKKRLLLLIKQLQDDYFNKQLISYKVFSEQSENYDSELDQIKERISQLEKKQKLD